ncbi:MAG: leucine-rich repeat protein [Oscillospiraceae bacterium]|nr:leucine-rich repeat protein [Oscillospiraceae bacterium]
MTNLSDFVIRDGVLKKYRGSGGNVRIPSGVTSIGDWAFLDCRRLTRVTILPGVTSIGGSAFRGCSGLTGVEIPASVTNIGEGAFWNCRDLTSVAIPESVTSIGCGVFNGCKALKRLTILSGIKQTKTVFMGTSPECVIANDPGKLPTALKPIAAISYAENPAEPGSEREKKHLKYIKSNATKLIDEALSHPALLGLMCEKKLLTLEVSESYFTAAQAQGKTEAVSRLLDYRENVLTAKEKEKAAQKAEQREEKVTDFIFSSEALEQLQGKVFAVTGSVKSFKSREEFKACLDACGAVLSETLNGETDYLITNTPKSGSAKNKKAEELGVKKLSEAEFNRLIGRS